MSPLGPPLWAIKILELLKEGKGLTSVELRELLEIPKNLNPTFHKHMERMIQNSPWEGYGYVVRVKSTINKYVIEYRLIESPPNH